MRHLLTAQSLKPDPNKLEAIIKLEAPETKEDIGRLNGTVNYLAKFLPRLSQVMESLRRLTQTGVEWYWGDAEDKAFNEVKQLVTQAPALVYYSPNKELVIQCDASSLGLGVVLMQEGRPLAYASRALTDLQGMLLRSLPYDIEIQYTLGHTQHLADMMSRSFLPAHGQATSGEFELVNAIQFLPMREGYRTSNSRLQRMKPCNCVWTLY